MKRITMQTTSQIQDIYTLTPMQEGMLFHTLLDKNSSSYFQQISYRIYGDLDIEVVKKSLAFLFRRHEILRTSFIHQSSKRPVQVVLKERKPDVYSEDLRQLYPGQDQAREELIRNFKEKDRERSFDLTRDVLLRLAVLRLDNREYEVIWSYHHILMDAWSTGILVSEFFTIYSGFLQGRNPQLPEVTPYRDYIQWLEAQDKKESQDYWLRFLEGYEEAVDIPRIKSIRSHEKGKKAYRNAVLYFSLDGEKTDALVRLAVDNQVSLNTLMQTLWGIFLGKYNRKQDVVFGAVVSGRSSKIQDVETMVGLFINTIPVRITFEEKTHFYQLAWKTRQRFLESEYYHFSPLAEIQAQSPLKQHLINHLFIFENRPVPQHIRDLLPAEKSNQQWKGFGVEKNEVFEQTNYDFNFYIAPSPNLTVKIAYNEYIYDRELVEKISLNFQHLMYQVLENPGITIKGLTILSEEERKQVLYEFNNTSEEYPADTPIHELFQQVVEKNPGHTALVFGEKHLTYRELDFRSNRLAAILQENSITSSCIVGVMTGRSLEMLVGMMAVLKAGAAYLPLDPAFPQERIQYMLQESDTAMVLILEDFIGHDRGLSFNGEILELKDPQLYQGMDTKLKNRVFSSQPAYIIYTSGSTGKPKGVIVEHQNVVNFNRGIISRIPFASGKAILALTTISFDIFVLETFLPLLNTLKVVIADEEQQRDPGLLGEVIVKHRLEMIQVTPSTLHMLLSSEEDLHCLKGVKELMVGGEAFPDHLFARVKQAFTGSIYNMYGPTETTVWSVVKDLTRKETVSIGTPIANTTIFILDRNNHLLPVGAAGELYIGGDGVARGYLNNPQLTHEKFTTNKKVTPKRIPGSNHRSHRSYTSYIIYKTGDLACWLLDGNIQFLGRIDHQVKLRGFRIELGEIESQLLSHKDIKEAVVVINEDRRTDKYICAYIVPHPGKVLNETGIREYLAGKLPYYMIPSYIIQLDHIPLTPNGKINRKALPDSDLTGTNDYIAPRNEIEEELVRMWSEVLGVSREKIGIDLNFFEAGGHSLKAVALVSGIHKAFNVKLTLAEFFKGPTIRQLSRYIHEAELDRFFSIEPTEKREYHPLSPAQKRLLFLQQLEETSTAYNMSIILEWQGLIDKPRLERTYRALISRHESLRTSFQTLDDQPVQRIHEQVEFEIEYFRFEVEAKVEAEEVLFRENLDASVDHFSKSKELKAESYISSFIRPFDLSRAPLLRVRLLEVSPDRYILVTDMHHIISDGVSTQLLTRDFVRLYMGKELPRLRLRYRDSCQWQENESQKKLMKRQQEYWTKEFSGEIPVLLLPIDYPRPALQSFAGTTMYFELSTVEVTRRLKALAANTGSTLFMVMLALYNIFLGKITGQEDIIVGTPLAGRRHTDLQKIIGNFVNTLALRCQPIGGKPWDVFLAEVKERALQAFEHQEYPYEDLVEQVEVKRDASRNPLFDTVLVMHNVDMPHQDIDSHLEEVTIRPYPSRGSTAKFDLTLRVLEGQNKLSAGFEYCTKLFKASTIQRFVRYFKEVVKSASENPTLELKEIDIVPEEEKQWLLSVFNHAHTQYPEQKTIHQLFADQVRKTPQHISVIYENRALTYKELERKSNQVAFHLKTHCGVKLEEPVALLLHRSEDIIISMLGILKAGGAYLPIDPDYPPERTRFMLSDSRTAIMVTSPEALVKADFEQGNGQSRGLPLKFIDTRNIPSTLTSTLTCQVSPKNLAYIIYTSGSTGKSKGVMVEHRNVVRLYFHQGSLFDFNNRDIWTMFHSPCFDFSVWEMYGALFFGGKVIIVPRLTARQPEKYLQLLKARNVTILNQTPTAFYSLAAEEQDHTNNHLHLKYVIFGGEALHPLKLKNWKNKYPGTRLINMFGITETTVHVTYKELEDEDIHQDLRCVGGPIPTLSAYIMSNHLKLLPTGIMGELCVGGAGVSRGYLNRPTLTAEKFIENPYSQGERLYRSGDLAKIPETMDIEYLGRKDHQVQLRGFRVELGEIEYRLLQHQDIKEAYVMDREDKTGDKYLCAYIVSEKDVKAPGLKEFLAQNLPEYMVPSYFVPLAALPLTTNGKVDRRALPEPGLAKPGKHLEKPRDQVEQKLAELWARVLGIDIELISSETDFFELGGHSLKAGILVAAVHKEMNVKIPLPQIFITPHLRGMAQSIRKAKKDEYFSIEPACKKEYYALSSAQRRLYIMQQVDPNMTTYNISKILALQGELNKGKLEHTFQQLIRRHENLRTSFEIIAEKSVQKIHEVVEFEIEYYDISEVEEGEGTIIKNFIRPFDLSRAPLMRVGLIERHTPAALHGHPSQEGREHKYILMVDMHHIITDGVSHNILIADFAALYEGNPLPKLRLQYKDFSQWQTSEVMKQSLANQKVYWLARFASLSHLNLTTDYERPTGKSFAGDSVYFIIDSDLNQQVRKLTEETGTTLFMVLLTVYNILVSCYSHQEDIVIGSPITGRRHADLHHIVGMFVNMLALRNQPARSKTFRGFLAEVKQNALEAYENQDYQFEQLIADLDLQGTVNRNPLFDVVFAMQKIDIDIREDAAGDSKGIESLNFTPYPFKKNTTPFDLLMSAYERENAIEMNLNYSTYLFKRSTAEKITRHYTEILEQVVRNKDIKLQDIRLSHQLMELDSEAILEYEGDFGF